MYKQRMDLRVLVAGGFVALAILMMVVTWREYREVERVGREWKPVRGEVRRVEGLREVLVQTEAGEERRLVFGGNPGLEAREKFEAREDPSGRVGARLWGEGQWKGVAILGLMAAGYLAAGAGFWWFTGAQRRGWMWFAAAPWGEAPDISTRLARGWGFPWMVGAGVLVLLVWKSGWVTEGEGWSRWAWGSVFAVGFVVLVLFWRHYSTYWLEADAGGVRERSAVSWKYVPWGEIRKLVEETRYHYGRPFNSRTTVLSRTEVVWVMEDGKGEMLVEVAAEIPVAAREAILERVRTKTGLAMEKRERKIGDSRYE